MDKLGLTPQAYPPASPTARSAKAPIMSSGLNKTRPNEQARLAKACSEFEALFIEQLFKTMRATVPDAGLLRGGRAEEIYTGILDQQIAVEMAQGQGSLGLASRLQSRLGPEPAMPKKPEIP